MAEASSMMEVTVTKAKRKLKVDTQQFSEATFAKIFQLGLKTALDKGNSKFKTKDLEGDALAAVQNEAYAAAEEHLQALYKDEYRFVGERGSAATKVPLEIRNEALRLAKSAITQQIKDDGGKISHYAKSDITKWAKELLEADSGYFKLAEEALAARKATPLKISLSGLKPNEKLVKAAEEKKAKAKKDKPTLSAKQASMPAVRQKGAKPTHASAH
jgi:hypothetical protein